MTEQELRDLDAELDNGTMDEEQYCATLRDEVARIHPDYDSCTIENMIRMQLRIEALETVLVEDVIESNMLDAGGVIEAASARKDSSDEHVLKEDDKDSQINALLQKLKEKAKKQAAEQKAGKLNPNGELGAAEKLGVEQQHVGQKDGNKLSGQIPQPDGHEVDNQQNVGEQECRQKPGQQKPGSQDSQRNSQDQLDQKEGSQQPQNGTQCEGTPNSSQNGQMQDQNDEQSDQQQNDQNKQNRKDGQSQQDQSKQDQSQQNQDQQKDNGKGGESNQKSKVWWTWQIVPDWNEWMKDEQT